MRIALASNSRYFECCRPAQHSTEQAVRGDSLSLERKTLRSGGWRESVAFIAVKRVSECVSGCEEMVWRTGFGNE